MNDASLADHVVDLLERTGEVGARRMFGGYGVFDSGLMFALIADGILFFKTDPENEMAFEERELPRFAYEKKGRTMHLNYRQAPPEALETAAAMKKWALLGMEAARRADKAKKKKTPKTGRKR